MKRAAEVVRTCPCVAAWLHDRAHDPPPRRLRACRRGGLFRRELTPSSGPDQPCPTRTRRGVRGGRNGRRSRPPPGAAGPPRPGRDPELQVSRAVTATGDERRTAHEDDMRISARPSTTEHPVTLLIFSPLERRVPRSRGLLVIRCTSGPRSAGGAGTSRHAVTHLAHGSAGPARSCGALTGRPSARHAWKPPIRSVARCSPSWCSDAAARLEAYPSSQITTIR